MNHFVISVFCLIIGFMLGVGAMFSSTQVIVSFQNKRVASLSDSYYKLESLNLKTERHYMDRLEECRKPRKRKN